MNYKLFKLKRKKNQLKITFGQNFWKRSMFIAVQKKINNIKTCIKNKTDVYVTVYKKYLYWHKWRHNFSINIFFSFNEQIKLLFMTYKYAQSTDFSKQGLLLRVSLVVSQNI